MSLSLRYGKDRLFLYCTGSSCEGTLQAQVERHTHLYPAGCLGRTRVMYEFCKHRGESLKPLLELPNGCPSVDTIERVISRIDPTAFAECLSVFGSTLVDDLKGKLVSIDGKRIRGSKSSDSYTHILISMGR